MHWANGQVVLIAGTGGQGACAPYAPGTEEPQYPCLNDGHADVLWQRGQCYTGQRFRLQLAPLDAQPDLSYGSCYDVDHAPEDWIP